MKRRHALLTCSVLASAALPAQAGALDPTFGAGGTVSAPANAQFRAVAVHANGSLVAVGHEAVSTSINRWLVQRFLPDGSLDTSFGTAGTVTVFGSTIRDRAYDVALDGNGNILVAGTATHASHWDMAVVRLLAVDGSLDASFGIGGITKVHAAAKASSGSEAWGGVAVQADGRIILAGYASGNRNIDLALARLTASGGLDSTFGSFGIVRDALSSTDDLPWYGAMALQPDGRVVLGAAAGSSTSPTESWYVMRYLTNGALDSTWGTGGRVRSTFAGFSYARVEGLAVQPDGKVIASGRARSDQGASGYDCCVARYLANGALDPTFGSGGFANSGLAGDDQGHGGVTRLFDDSLVLGVQKDGAAVAVRFFGGGHVDPTFGNGGVSATAWPGFAWDVQLDSLGRLMVAGDDGLARYLTF